MVFNINRELYVKSTNDGPLNRVKLQCERDSLLTVHKLTTSRRLWRTIRIAIVSVNNGSHAYLSRLRIRLVCKEPIGIRLDDRKHDTRFSSVLFGLDA